MQQHYGVVLLLLICISGYEAQTTSAISWNGDPTLCTIDTPPTPSPLPVAKPRFPTIAEFTLERIELKSVLSMSGVREMIMYQYLYDFDKNSLVLIKNEIGFLSVDYFYYKELKKSTYFGRDFCEVSNITTNLDMDGTSAIQWQDGTWHIRPLNEFLLFESNNPNQPVTPVYLGTTTIRGIPVDKWQSCYIDRTQFRTVKRVSYFAQSNVVMPGTTADKYTIPVQTLVSASYDFPNGTKIAEVDEVFNFLSFRSGIVENADQLSPPKGVFCDAGPSQPLVSLNEVGIVWPDHFSVRVDTSTSLSSRWQRFHLRYSLGRQDGVRRLRYDFMPPGSEDYESVIHDYSDNLTYVIDRRVGSCKISRGVEIPDVSPIRDPIRFFVKHEAKFIFDPPKNIWEFNGLRPCRGGSIRCTIATAKIRNFPVRVEADTGLPSGDTWAATNVEYGWSSRAPFAEPRPGEEKGFDYPVSLYLKMYQYENPLAPSPLNARIEDVEYEFYEMSHERHPDDFDTGLCYRALNYDYLHLDFALTTKSGQSGVFDSKDLNRLSLQLATHRTLTNIMNIKFQRIVEMEIEHETADNNVQVFFTLLGQTPRPGTASGVADDEPTAQKAQDDLRSAIDSGGIEFNVRTINNDTVTLVAVANSLQSARHYRSTHAAGKKDVSNVGYKSSSIALAVLVGLAVGIITGIITVVIYRTIKKQPLPISVSNPIPTIKFRSKASAASTPSATSA